MLVSYHFAFYRKMLVALVIFHYTDTTLLLHPNQMIFNKIRKNNNKIQKDDEKALIPAARWLDSYKLETTTSSDFTHRL